MLQQWYHSFFLLDDFVVQCNLVGGLVSAEAGLHAIPDVTVFWRRCRHGSLFSGWKSLVLMRVCLNPQSQFPRPSSMQRAHSSWSRVCAGGAVLRPCRFSSARVSPFLPVPLFSGFLLRSPLEEGGRLGSFLSPPPALLHWLGHELRPGEGAWLCGFGFQIHLLRFRL